MTQSRLSLHRKTVSPTQAGPQHRRQVSRQLRTNPDLALHEAESSTDDETPPDCCPDHRRPPVLQPSNNATSNQSSDFTLHDSLRASMTFRVNIDSMRDAFNAVPEDRERLQARLRKGDLVGVFEMQGCKQISPNASAVCLTVCYNFLYRTLERSLAEASSSLVAGVICELLR